MNKQTLLCICGLVIGQAFIAGCAAPQVVTRNPEALAKIKRIAVIPFSDSPGALSRKSGQATAGFLMAEISQSNRYDLVERTQIKALMDEQDLQISSIADPSTAKKFGKLLGVDAVMVGSVSQYQHSKGYANLVYVTLPTNEYTIAATVRIINVADAKVVYAIGGCGKSGNNFDEAGRKFAKPVLAPLPR